MLNAGNIREEKNDELVNPEEERLGVKKEKSNYVYLNSGHIKPRSVILRKTQKLCTGGASSGRVVLFASESSGCMISIRISVAEGD